MFMICHGLRIHETHYTFLGVHMTEMKTCLSAQDPIIFLNS